MSHSHQLVSSASELVILLLSCVTDISQVSTAQAMVHFADTSDMLQTLRLSPDVRQVLETFVMSLSLIIGDDAKAAREAQMMQSLQLVLGKSDVLGPSSDADTVTCGLVLHNLVCLWLVVGISTDTLQLFSRSSAFGAGSGPEAVASFIGILRWKSWTPTVFYTQMLLSAFTCVSQCGSTGADAGAFFLWRAFVVGRV
jgi:mediator of RNA polymerase II transcription subunit 5